MVLLGSSSRPMLDVTSLPTELWGYLTHRAHVELADDLLLVQRLRHSESPSCCAATDSQSKTMGDTT